MPRRIIVNKCQICNTEFKVSPSKVKKGFGKYCSIDCRTKGITTKVRCVCRVCGAVFYTVPGNIKRGGGKFCSKHCLGVYLTKQASRVCEVCGEGFTCDPNVVKKGHAKFCSRECKHEALRIADLDLYFLSRVLIPENVDGCWIWVGAINGGGYGEIKSMGVKVLAHRYSYERWNGPIPEGLFILHSCHNPACCRPDHLRPGTIKENAQDMVNAGRSARGEKNSNAKLNDGKVEMIRELYASGKYSLAELGRYFGVSESTLSAIISYKTWRHVRVKKQT